MNRLAVIGHALNPFSLIADNLSCISSPPTKKVGEPHEAIESSVTAAVRQLNAAMAETDHQVGATQAWAAITDSQHHHSGYAFLVNRILNLIHRFTTIVSARAIWLPHSAAEPEADYKQRIADARRASGFDFIKEQSEKAFTALYNALARLISPNAA